MIIIDRTSITIPHPHPVRLLTLSRSLLYPHLRTVNPLASAIPRRSEEHYQKLARLVAASHPQFISDGVC